jgi:hypothetical protein
MRKFTSPLSQIELRRFSMAFALVLLLGSAATSRAQTTVVYNSIPHPLPPNVASEGPEAYAFSELGDGVALAGPAGRTLDKVTVVLSSWACTSGNWHTAGTCVTTPNATFTLPITVNIYSVVPGSSLEGDSTQYAVGSLLANTTKSFTIPYRPSSDSINCDGTAWYDQKFKTCNHGVAVPITFDLSFLHVTLPGQIIVGIQFDSTHYGPSPLGESAACFSTAEGCFYDSLNISTDSNDGFYQAIGSVLDVNGIFVHYTSPSQSCTGSASVTMFGLDVAPGCWTGYHPEIRITAEKDGHERVYHHGDDHENHHGDDHGDNRGDDHRNNRRDNRRGRDGFEGGFSK